jgi:hypothetical protein
MDQVVAVVAVAVADQVVPQVGIQLIPMAELARGSPHQSLEA